MTHNAHNAAPWPEQAAAAAADARGRLRARFVLLLAAFLIVWAFAEGVAIWGNLPQQIPTHFGFRGEPDAWGPKTVFTVFGPLIVAAVLLLLLAFFASRRFSPRHWNLPRKKFLLTLPPALQDHVIAPIREGLAWLAAAIAIGLALLCRQAWAVALDRQAAISPSLILITIAIGTGAVVVGMVHSNGRSRSLEKAS